MPQLDFSNPKAAATAELMFEIIRDLGDQDLIDTGIGECLYAGIMTDTGSFRHPSTSRNVHLIIAELLNAGINLSDVHRRIYDSHSEERLRFLGFVLKDKLTVLREYNTAYIAITADELRQYHSKTGDTEGLVNFALSIEGIVFAAILIDRRQAIKISFRSVGNFSVSEFSRRSFQRRRPPQRRRRHQLRVAGAYRGAFPRPTARVPGPTGGGPAGCRATGGYSGCNLA